MTETATTTTRPRTSAACGRAGATVPTPRAPQDDESWVDHDVPDTVVLVAPTRAAHLPELPWLTAEDAEAAHLFSLVPEPLATLLRTAPLPDAALATLVVAAGPGGVQHAAQNPWIGEGLWTALYDAAAGSPRVALVSHRLLSRRQLHHVVHVAREDDPEVLVRVVGQLRTADLRELHGHRLPERSLAVVRSELRERFRSGRDRSPARRGCAVAPGTDRRFEGLGSAVDDGSAADRPPVGRGRPRRGGVSVAAAERAPQEPFDPRSRPSDTPCPTARNAAYWARGPAEYLLRSLGDPTWSPRQVDLLRARLGPGASSEAVRAAAAECARARRDWPRLAVLLAETCLDDRGRTRTTATAWTWQDVVAVARAVPVG